MLHDEQYVQPLEQQGVDADEVGGEMDLRNFGLTSADCPAGVRDLASANTVAELSPLSPPSPQLTYLCTSCSETVTARGRRGDGTLLSVLALSNSLSPRHYG